MSREEPQANSIHQSLGYREVLHFRFCISPQARSCRRRADREPRRRTSATIFPTLFMSARTRSGRMPKASEKESVVVFSRMIFSSEHDRFGIDRKRAFVDFRVLRYQVHLQRIVQRADEIVRRRLPPLPQRVNDGPVHQLHPVAQAMHRFHVDISLLEEAPMTDQSVKYTPGG
jgi:hypothetical protein